MNDTIHNDNKRKTFSNVIITVFHMSTGKLYYSQWEKSQCNTKKIIQTFSIISIFISHHQFIVIRFNNNFASHVCLQYSAALSQKPYWQQKHTHILISLTLVLVCHIWTQVNTSCIDNVTCRTNFFIRRSARDHRAAAGGQMLAVDPCSGISRGLGSDTVQHRAQLKTAAFLWMTSHQLSWWTHVLL